jgi:GNAT superfamily N-acetyltransferase
MTGTQAVDIGIRPYEDADEARVLRLLDDALGGGPAGRRTADLFRWKHVENPFGRSMMLVAESDGRIVGLRAFMRWSFLSGSRALSAVRAVDTATHPDHQGRGIFLDLTREALEVLRIDTDLVFNTPNEKSLPGYLKLGWVEVGTIPTSIRVKRPVAFVRGVRSVRSTVQPSTEAPEVHAERADALLREGEAVRELLEEARSVEARLHTPVDLAFLRWRYGDAPLLDYRAIGEWSGDRLRGLVFFRLRPRGELWELAVADVVTAPGDRSCARRLLRAVVAACRADHAMSIVPAGSSIRGAFARAGFVATRRGVLLVTRVLQPGITPDPRSLDSWAPTLGTLEVF